MLAASNNADIGSPGTLPVCPRNGNPNRLVTLWDMLSLNAAQFTAIFALLGGVEFVLKSGKRFDGDPSGVARGLRSACEACTSMDLPISAAALRRLADRLDRADATPQELHGLFECARNTLHDELQTRVFLQVPTARASYYEPAGPLFGKLVADKFPSCTWEISEAGRCYALARNTGCVFHLMRVLELGLTALGKVFDVSLAHTNWGPAIDQIESRIRKMHEDPLWKGSDNRKELQEFYSQAVSHLGIAKDAWRNYTAHVRGKYDEQEAADIMTGVRAFMQKLAEQVSD